MDVSVEQNCPSCGAAIVIQEDDRLLRCDYCSGYNYRLAGSGGRYVLPFARPATLGDDQLVFVPYLRFKGSIFYVRDLEVQHKIVDTTRVGMAAGDSMPVSLGLRPQAMRLRPVVAATPGAFLRQSVPIKEVFAQAVQIIDLFGERREQVMHHRAFIGETLSLIYQPCFLHGDRLIDAVTCEPVGSGPIVAEQLHRARPSQRSWEPRFIATACPGCGGLLSGEPDSLVLHCDSCRTFWQERDGAFAAVPWQVVATGDRSARYLPFWQITCTTSGGELQSYGDYLRLTNQPLVVSARHDRLPLCFWIPAFKVNPKAFLQLASQLTVGQLRLPAAETEPLATFYPVTLDQAEAQQAIKCVLANTMLAREHAFPQLRSLQPVECRSILTFLPFISQTHDLVQEHTFANIQVAALRYGRTL